MKKKISTGLAEHISPSGVVKCGGVAVKPKKISRDVSLENTRQKTIMKTILLLKKRKTEKGNEC
jgi:hypothetical protein